MGDVLSILEAAYSEADDADAWLEAALVAIQPRLDRGDGVLAHRFQHRADGVWTGKVHQRGVAPPSPFTDELVRAAHSTGSKKDWKRIYPFRPTVGWSGDLIGAAASAELNEFLRANTGTREASSESLGVIAGDPSGHGCIFYTCPAPVPPRGARKRGEPARPAPQALEHWRRIAAHLVAGYRLARQRESLVDAVFSPAGRLLHRERAVGREQSEALGGAARAIDRARGPLRHTDPDRALRIWRDLVGGRWSLVDHFDHDGRRFVVAKRNAPNKRSWSALTEREARVVAQMALGQSHKIIADALGISITAVASDLASARTKMGARSRLELAASYRAEHTTPEDEG